MTRKPKTKKVKKKWVTVAIYSAALAMVLAGGGAWWAADRFLIEKVEVSAQTNATQEAVASAEASETAQTTDNTYSSDSKKVTITTKTVTTSSGTAKVYIADVVLDSATSLQSAFAKDQFGANIVDTPSNIAEDNNAIFAINGDYYGFRDDGIIIRNGVIYRDKGARTGLAIYTDGSMKIYDETTTSAQELLDAGVWQTISFGPALVVDGQVQSGFKNTAIDTNFGNRTIDGANPRTGIGMISDNHFVFVVVEGRTSDSSGMTLDEFAQLFKDLGVTQAYNLDGGYSSAMYFNGEIITSDGRERSTSDIFYLTGSKGD